MASTPSRPTSQRARERAEVRRQEIAERARKDARRRLLLRIAVPVAVVLVVVGAFVGLKAAGVGSSDTPEGVVATGAAPAALVQEITTIPAADFDAVGAGSDVTGPTTLDGASALTADGKPRILYVGGEFCPYCAAERWVIVTALARFGTWSDLQQTNSSADDVYPDTATLSFHGATYTSDYLVFDGVETTDRDHQPLETLDAADETLVQTYDPDGTIPFQILGGTYSQNGSSVPPPLLQGKTHSQIAAAIADPGTDIGKAVLAAANRYTAAVCTLTGGNPGDVCTSAGVTAAAAQLGS